jgi:porin
MTPPRGQVTAENYAVALSANWTIGRRVPFLLTGVGNGEGAGTLSKAPATGGVGHKLRSHDFLAGSFNWTKPTGDDLRDQYTVEVFYRFYFSERLAFTPDLQWVISPSLNPNDSLILLFGIRARVEF